MKSPKTEKTHVLDCCKGKKVAFAIWHSTMFQVCRKHQEAKYFKEIIEITSDPFDRTGNVPENKLEEMSLTQKEFEYKVMEAMSMEELYFKDKVKFTNYSSTYYEAEVEVEVEFELILKKVSVDIND